MKKHLKKIIIAALLLLSIGIVFKFKTSETQQYTQGIRPPISENDLPFDSITFNADSGVKVIRTNGTFINIAPNSLVDSMGEYVTGQVKLKFREFHQADDLFRSGIPMSVDSTRRAFLQSAGMIELRASSNGRNLDFGEGKYAEIELANYRNTDGYSLYHLKDDKNWAVTDTFKSGINLRKQNGINEIDAKLKKGKFKDIIFDIVTNLDNAPYLRAFKNLQWKIDGRDVNDEVIEAMRIDWDEVKVVPTNGFGKKYSLAFMKKFEMGGDKKTVRRFSVNAMPLHAGSLSKVSKNEMGAILNDYDSVLVLMENEKKRLEQQTNLVNSFKINQMGVWNVDRIMKLSDVEWCSVEFDFQKNLDLNVNKISMYLMFLDDNSVIEYLPKDWNKVGFKKTGKMEIKVVLPGGKIAVVDNDQISKGLLRKTNKLLLNTLKK